MYITVCVYGRPVNINISMQVRMHINFMEPRLAQVKMLAWIHKRLFLHHDALSNGSEIIS
jgi:hypothetical protein